MKIVIVGPGAIGCLFAGLLVKTGRYDVCLLDKNETRAKYITENGLRIEGLGGQQIISEIKAIADPESIGIADLILFCVKSYDTIQAARFILPIVGDNTIILTLQNGLNNVESASNILGEDKVIAGITSHGSTMIDIGHVRHAGVGDTIIGEPKGGISKRVIGIQEILNSAGFDTKIVSNISSFIWGKLIINAAINPITAITRLKNGEILKHPDTRKLMTMTVLEAKEVAFAKHISLPYGDPVFAVESVCEATSSNISSMLQDVLRKKRTEIDAINGAIFDIANRMNLKVPVNTTLLFLVKGIERSYEQCI